MRMLSLSRSPPALVWLYVDGMRPSRAREGKIRVKCQFAKKYLEFLRKRRMWRSCHDIIEQIEPIGGS